MNWVNSALEVLNETYGHRPFSAREAITVLNKEKGYTRNSVYLVLSDSRKKGSLIKLGKGVYTFPKKGSVNLSSSFTITDKVTLEVTSGGLNKAREKLNEKGIEFMITGPSILTRFHHYMSWRYIHLIYVTKGSGEYSVKTLRENDFFVLLNPKRKEIETILENVNGKDLFIIREFFDLEGSINSRASIERALIDTYFEATRKKIPYSDVEVGRIIANVFREERIDITHLLNLASRRGIKKEFGEIVKEIIPDYPITSESKNDHVKNVLQGIKE